MARTEIKAKSEIGVIGKRVSGGPEGNSSEERLARQDSRRYSGWSSVSHALRLQTQVRSRLAYVASAAVASAGRHRAAGTS